MPAFGRSWWSLASTGALYLGFHEGRLVVDRVLTPEQAEEATPLHPYLTWAQRSPCLPLSGSRLAILASALHGRSGPAAPVRLRRVRSSRARHATGARAGVPRRERAPRPGRRGGDVIVNLHAQLNMLGGLMVVLVGLALAVCSRLGSPWPADAAASRCRRADGRYYGFGSLRGGRGAPGPTGARSPCGFIARALGHSCSSRPPLPCSRLLGLCSGRLALTEQACTFAPRLRRHAVALHRSDPDAGARQAPRLSPATKLPLGLLGFPGVGWLFAGFPSWHRSCCLRTGARVGRRPDRFHAHTRRSCATWVEGRARLSSREVLFSAALLYRAHAGGGRACWAILQEAGACPRSYRARVSVAAGTMALVFSSSCPSCLRSPGWGRARFVTPTRPRLTSEVTGQFLSTPGGLVKLFSWSDPQNPYPSGCPSDSCGGPSWRSRGARRGPRRTGRVHAVRPRPRRNCAPARRSIRTTALRLAPRPPPGTLAGMPSQPRTEACLAERDFAYITVVSG